MGLRRSLARTNQSWLTPSITTDKKSPALRRGFFLDWDYLLGYDIYRAGTFGALLGFKSHRLPLSQ